MVDAGQPGQQTKASERNEATYRKIRDRICTNRYPPETVLHEEELAEEFSVSRTPIRRVLSMLQHDGLVRVRHGVGNIVTAVDPAQQVEVYSVRMVLAQAAGNDFRLPFPAEIIEQLTRSRREFLDLDEGDVVGFGETNIRYYMALTGLVQNSCLRELQRKLFFQTSRMWLISLPSMPWVETLAAVADELEELIRVIRLEDPIGLGLVMRNHIFMSRRRVLIGLGIPPGDPRYLL